MANGGHIDNDDREEPGAGSEEGSGVNGDEEGSPSGSTGASPPVVETGAQADEESDGGNSEGSGASPSEQAGVSANLHRWRKFLLPAVTLVFLVTILLTFQTVLLPFVFACAIVYLMEPIVRRLSGDGGRFGGLPRWISVILVYLVFFGTVTISSVLIVPQFVSETLRFAESVPEAIHDFREEKLPGINERVQSYLEGILPGRPPGMEVEEAKTRVAEAREAATDRALAFATAKRTVRHASDVDARADANPTPMPAELYPSRVSGTWQHPGDESKPAFRVKPLGPGEGFEVHVNPETLEVVKAGGDAWRLRKPAEETSPKVNRRTDVRAVFDLEQRLNHAIESALTFSNDRLQQAINVAQSLVLGIVQVFVAIVLTLMVAAFISIDLPSFMNFFRELVPEDWHDGYDELLTRVDTGLAGVVRGQLMICVVNAIFTYIGLVILEVKFSLLLAVVAGALSLIPVFGTVISTIPIVIIASTSSLMTGVLALGWILLIHFVEANILNPKIIGTSAHIHPVIVIFALLAGESAFGLVGAVLAVPTASILLTLFKFTRDRVWDEERAVE